MTDREYVEFLNKCASIPHNDYSWLKDHCYKTLKRPCSPNTRNEHLAILDLIKEHEERQWIPVSERLPNAHEVILATYEVEDGSRIAITEYNKYGFLVGNVTAWMPLPEHYKEAEDV